MKLIYIIMLFPFFWAQADNKDYSKVEMLIQQNSIQLEQGDVSSRDALDRKRGLDIAKDIQAGNCPKHIDTNIMFLVIKNLVKTELEVAKAQKVFDCIESVGFKKEENYTLMTDLLPSWKADNHMLELFYSKFFKGYKKPNTSVLGLLDIAKIMCASDAINYLEKNDYPTNYDKTMTHEEYSLFEEYVKEYRCSGY
ncbi:MAG: hypothetical protein ACI88H_003857 [Cocleimonas sp.]|jgi:hypothetical protein